MPVVPPMVSAAIGAMPCPTRPRVPRQTLFLPLLCPVRPEPAGRDDHHCHDLSRLAHHGTSGTSRVPTPDRARAAGTIHDRGRASWARSPAGRCRRIWPLALNCSPCFTACRSSVSSFSDLSGHPPDPARPLPEHEIRLNLLGLHLPVGTCVTGTAVGASHRPASVRLGQRAVLRRFAPRLAAAASARPGHDQQHLFLAAHRGREPHRFGRAGAVLTGSLVRVSAAFVLAGEGKIWLNNAARFPVRGGPITPIRRPRPAEVHRGFQLHHLSLLFLPAVLLLNGCTRGRASNVLLLVASLLFYAWGEGIYLLVMLASILGNFAAGLFIDRFRRTTAGRRRLASAWAQPGPARIFQVRWLPRRQPQPAPRPRRPARGGLLHRCTCPSASPFSPSRPFPISWTPPGTVRGTAHHRSRSGTSPSSPADRRAHRALPRHRRRDRPPPGDDIDFAASGTVPSTAWPRRCSWPTRSAWWRDKIFALPVAELFARPLLARRPCYTFQIYYDFSGYFDMAIGLGRDVRFPLSRKLQLFYIAAHPGLWRRWAHLALQLAARLRVHPAGRQPRQCSSPTAT